MNLNPAALDLDVYQWVTERRGDPWIFLSHAVTLLGNTLPLAIITVAVVAGLAARRHYSTAQLVGVGALGGYLLMVALKAVFGRDRPPVADRLVEIDTHSFPSGHAMMSTICYGLFAVAAYHLSVRVRRYPWILLSAPVLAVLIGCSRVYLGVHWTTDVIAGWILGALWVALSVGVWRRLGRHSASRTDQKVA